MTPRRLVRIALMTVIICVCSIMTVPFTVPFTLQTFGVAFALLLLGGSDGLISIGLYIVLGALGLPVFSGFGAGIGHLLGPTGGFVAGFLLMGVLYWLTEKRFKPLTGIIAGQLVCYAAGTAWFVHVTGVPLLTALLMCVAPYVLPDGLKIYIAYNTAMRIKPFV